MELLEQPGLPGIPGRAIDTVCHWTSSLSSICRCFSVPDVVLGVENDHSRDHRSHVFFVSQTCHLQWIPGSRSRISMSSKSPKKNECLISACPPPRLLPKAILSVAKWFRGRTVISKIVWHGFRGFHPMAMVGRQSWAPLAVLPGAGDRKSRKFDICLPRPQNCSGMLP